ncbi:MAG: hypothetical protein Q7S28_01375 [bacterium]|nr:hypothetical protein [bacterium]
MLSLVFLIGTIAVIIAVTIAFLALSFLNSSAGFQAANKALTIASGGIHDAILQLVRTNNGCGPVSCGSSYCVPYPCVTGSTATVTITNPDPLATDQAIIVSQATVSGYTRKLRAIVKIDSTTGIITLVSQQVSL